MVDKRLGRGLEFFLSGAKGAPAPSTGATPADETLQVEVGLLGPNPQQPREAIQPDEIRELTESIRATGILQPILARRVGTRFEIVAGERRWRAAMAAGLEKVPVLVRTISDEESGVFALVENLQREDLHAIEKATAFQKLLNSLKCSQEELAKRVGLDRSTVANFLRLLDLPKDVQAHVSRGTLSMGHARALLGLPTAEFQSKVAEEAIRRGLSVRDVEGMVKQLALGAAPNAEAAATTAEAAKKKTRPVWLNELEETLVETLGTPVAIRYGRKRSKIVIECTGREEFDRIYAKLKAL